MILDVASLKKKFDFRCGSSRNKEDCKGMINTTIFNKKKIKLKKIIFRLI